MKSKFAIIPLVLAAAGLSQAGTTTPAVAPATGNTAVSEPNGKLDSSFANLDGEDAWLNQGSFSIPLAQSLGFQLDALQTHTSDSDFAGIGGHLFWRDYQVGLLGITAGGVWGDDADSYEIGLEAERYFDWFTIGARAGFADIDYDPGFFPTNQDDNGIYAIAYLTAYPIEDLAITLSVGQRFDNTLVSLGAEYDLPIENLTAIAEVAWGEDDYEHAMIGLRYYFGSGKSLKMRHRQDDPQNILSDIQQPMLMQDAPLRKGRGDE
ncbi:MAG TPA: hypothetical protein VFY13_05815 [Luteolibacter sp.]|nr:hypothetical protein [Luteolibacter sp.]